MFMYFPHLELVFLLFAYQGASTAEARMIQSGCFPLVVMGAIALVSVRETHTQREKERGRQTDTQTGRQAGRGGKEE